MNKIMNNKKYDDIIDFIKINLDNKDFLAYSDNFECADRIIVWAVNSEFEKLKASKTWLMDSTFRVAHKNFTQLYTIHGVVFGTRILLVYCLMKNNNKVSYQKLLKLIFQKISTMPEFVICDLETAVINTINEIFPSTNIRTCQFFMLRLSGEIFKNKT
ncbi:hypothetical protein DMUE_0287 [Dictyocoela muelleri]|nr:hypothetical protein DMUE_0287 [Dictyocoela muelleri]